ncbi:MAG TPA: hypothetical protein VFH71_12945 [Rhodanobacteraceae bacterium]|nr:hypothetical protein [Rhodanobacteraceae bacterium]
MNAHLVEQRLAFAKAAVALVKSKLTLGPGNRIMDPVVASRLQMVAQKAGYGEFLSHMARFATVMVAPMAEASIIKYRFEDWWAGKPPSPRTWAEEAVQGRAGNCDEQSCVALVYLYDNKVRPLDWMHLTNGRHSFVLIGRDATSGLDPATWGEDVVVCDPWNNDAYPLDPRAAKQTLLDKMKCGCAAARSVLHVPGK